MQKGTQDFPARIHAPLETFLISKLCKTAITSGQLTVSWIILAFGTTILFATGHLIWGIVLALIIGILDGLDGKKQARIRVETSKTGKIRALVRLILRGGLADGTGLSLLCLRPTA